MSYHGPESLGQFTAIQPVQTSAFSLALAQPRMTPALVASIADVLIASLPRVAKLTGWDTSMLMQDVQTRATILRALKPGADGFINPQVVANLLAAMNSGQKSAVDQVMASGSLGGVAPVNPLLVGKTVDGLVADVAAGKFNPPPVSTPTIKVTSIAPIGTQPASKAPAAEAPSAPPPSPSLVPTVPSDAGGQPGPAIDVAPPTPTDLVPPTPAEQTTAAVNATAPAAGFMGVPWMYIGVGAAGVAVLGLLLMRRKPQTPNKRRGRKSSRRRAGRKA